MRTSRRALLLIGALAFALGVDASAQGRSIRIRNFDALLAVHPDGSLDVTEQLTIGFTGQWNGINRDLSLHHNTAQGRATKLDVTIGYITDETGQRLRVEEQSQDNGWTRRLHIYVPGANDADRQITIRYKVANAIRFFYASSKVGALDELYWNVTGNNWSMFIDSVHARVVLPDGVTPTRTAVYTGARGSIATDAKIEKNGNEVDFTLLRGLYPYEGMTIGVGWPAGHISSRPSEASERLARVLQWFPLLIPLIVFVLAFKAWEKRGRDPKEGSYVVRYEPVEGASPAELGTLVDNRADMDDITATLVDLAVRGFIRIEEVTESHFLGLSKSTDYIIRILRDGSQWTGLKPHEMRYLEKLTELAPIGESEVKVSEMRNKFYAALPKIRDAIYDSSGLGRLLPRAPRQGEGKMDWPRRPDRGGPDWPHGGHSEDNVRDALAHRTRRRRRFEHTDHVRVRADHARPHHRRRPRPRSHARLQGIPRPSGGRANEEDDHVAGDVRALPAVRDGVRCGGQVGESVRGHVPRAADLVCRVGPDNSARQASRTASATCRARRRAACRRVRARRGRAVVGRAEVEVVEAVGAGSLAFFFFSCRQGLSS